MDRVTRRAATFRERAGRVAAAGTAAAAVSVAVVPLGQAGAGAATAHGTKITVAHTSSFGKVLSDGTTLYTLKPSSTPCTAKCDKVWPPVVLPRGMKHPSAGHGVTASKLGAKRVPGVGLQATYKGRLLYWYVGDTARGQVNGNFRDRWGKWSPAVLSTSHSASGSTSKSTSGSTSGSNAGSGSTSGSNAGSGSTSGSNAGTGGVSF